MGLLLQAARADKQSAAELPLQEALARQESCNALLHAAEEKLAGCLAAKVSLEQQLEVAESARDMDAVEFTHESLNEAAQTVRHIPTVSFLLPSRQPLVRKGCLGATQGLWVRRDRCVSMSNHPQGEQPDLARSGKHACVLDSDQQRQSSLSHPVFCCVHASQAPLCR